MSIEALLQENTAAVKRLTEVMLAQAGGSSAAATGGDKAASGKGKGKADKSESKITQDQMSAALVKLKDAHGGDAAKAIIKEFGKVDKMADIKPAQFQAVHDAAVAKFEELENGGNEDGDDDI